MSLVNYQYLYIIFCIKIRLSNKLEKDLKNVLIILLETLLNLKMMKTLMVYWEDFLRFLVRLILIIQIINKKKKIIFKHRTISSYLMNLKDLMIKRSVNGY